MRYPRRYHQRRPVYATGVMRDLLAAVASVGAPSPGPLLREMLAMSTQAEVLATLGCGYGTLRSWIRGTRRPSGAAIRLIWLVHRVWSGAPPTRMVDFLGWLPPTGHPAGKTPLAGQPEAKEAAPSRLVWTWDGE